MNSLRKKHIIGMIEISAISILTLALIVMFAGYCVLVSSSSSSKTSIDKLYADAIFAPADNIENKKILVSPGFMGFCADKMLSPATPDAKKGFFDEIAPFLSQVFSDVSTTLEFSSSDSAYEHIESELSKHGEYLYISFPCDIPASAINSILGFDDSASANHAFSASEIYIFCEENGALSGICSDKSGNTATLNVRNRTSLSFETLKRYTSETEGMARFEFAYGDNKKYPVYSGSVANYNLVAYNSTEGNVLENHSALSGILSAFGFDPNNTRFFRSGNTITYVEQFGELTVSGNGDVTYTREADGIPLSELCGKIKDNYSPADKIYAAYNIISSLDRNIYGGYSELTIDSISYSDGILNISFIYSADGIGISDETVSATLLFGNNSLHSAQVVAKGYARLESTHTDIPQKLLFTLFEPQFSENAPKAFLPYYAKSEEDGVYRAKYAFIFDSDESKGGAEE